jgi:demethylmenaquinone methyltransferase/2-methoxy-6-polyprenyl-1,4-benzoquinol methylase
MLEMRVHGKHIVAALDGDVGQHGLLREALPVRRNGLRRHGIGSAQLNAENLPFANSSFDCITIAFGLRNVTDKPTALASMYRVLKTGGKLLVLEFSKPADALKPAYDFYSFRVLPLLGKLVANDEQSYRYLAESIRVHPDQESLLQMLQQAGFERCRYHNLAAGIVALHVGYKV